MIKQNALPSQLCKVKSRYFIKRKLNFSSCRPPSQEAAQQTSPTEPQTNGAPVPVSMNPLQVQGPNDPHPRVPTMAECEVIISHLQDCSDRQSLEVRTKDNFQKFQTFYLNSKILLFHLLLLRILFQEATCNLQL